MILNNKDADMWSIKFYILTYKPYIFHIFHVKSPETKALTLFAPQILLDFITILYPNISQLLHIISIFFI